jgi:hypothetical protein
MIAGDAKKKVPTPRGAQGPFYCAPDVMNSRTKDRIRQRRTRATTTAT